LESGAVDVFQGHDPVSSSDGKTVAFIDTQDGDYQIYVIRVGGEPTIVYESSSRIENLALSPDGQTVVFQQMIRENWELMVVSSGDAGPRQLTHDVQHDLFPKFLDANTILSVKGEGRHRRSYLHDLESGKSTRLFHNNTVRTVAPEYDWVVDRTGQRILIVSERDGDTISPERGLYLVDLNRFISAEDLQVRIDENRAVEARLKRNGEELFRPVAASVREAVASVSTSRIYGYEKALFAFGSKFITQPGNARAIEYLTKTLESFGYKPELQWFEPRPGIQSANVIATLKGSVDADLIYVISSHFDSVERGPGADDNTSGTAALLEAARVMAGMPQPATIKFAFFTGEEAGLLGSREFVRRAVADGDQIVGALNNDMVGYANNNRLDNTIRYSNDGIRDIQHGAAMLFTDLITYDARYYKRTDAHAYYEAYGDIVGGIGSYPILANPHYHQTHDVLETINHQLVAEVSKTTTATIMLLASSPSRLTDFQMTRSGESVELSWTPAVESGITGYRVLVRTEGLADRIEETSTPRISLSDVSLRAVLSVWAINAAGMPSWDSATVQSQ
ncbi:MAG: M20/M25/M40 family metallo-hydrolase, partial [Bacteroidetes bacterium]